MHQCKMLAQAAESHLQSVISTAAAEISLDDPPDVLAAALKGATCSITHAWQQTAQARQGTREQSTGSISS